MSADNSSQFIFKKAYEICYAVFRVASGLEHDSFIDHLEDQGLSLLKSAVRDDHENLLLSSKSLEYLLRIGSDVNIINAQNSDLICDELSQLNSAIAGLKKSANPLPIDLSDIFSKQSALIADTEVADVDEYPEIMEDMEMNSKRSSGRPLLVNLNEGVITTNASSSNLVVKAAMRQSAILELIRQSDNCHLKDLQEYFKDTSERTIRYDIQGLMGKGLVDRIGNGGPATYYKARIIEL